MSSKKKIINDIYFDRAGFGSKATTLKDAREKDTRITVNKRRCGRILSKTC